MDNLEKAMNTIGMVLDREGITIETDPEVINLLRNIKKSYVLQEFPQSQEFMDEEWFQDEAICTIGSEDRFGSAAYLIPLRRILG